ncbi:unnamed protein product [Toxocara canis]|uniref:Secreted protein n=1 Tax=Toxocara canis TaxID=6265 RepID=A0A183UMM8_TOXCA|nr:unnamed protein product [Toxocara canis]
MRRADALCCIATTAAAASATNADVAVADAGADADDDDGATRRLASPPPPIQPTHNANRLVYIFKARNYHCYALLAYRFKSSNFRPHLKLL